MPDVTAVTKTLERYAWDIDAETGSVREIVKE